MDPRLPEDVAQFFAVYLQRFQAVLPDRLHGCYLYGSMTLGAFHPAASDLDFLTVLASPLKPEELQTLDRLHRALNRKYPLARRLEGEYVPLADLQQGNLAKGYVRYHHGKYSGINPVMTLYWYQLHTAGVRLAGPAPQTLFPPIPWEAVHQEMERNVNGYWLHVAQRRYTSLLSDSMAEFAILTLCRILFTLEHRQITSKEAAGQWALELLPDWRQLINEGLRLRAGQDKHSLYPTRWQRRRAVRDFILAMARECNARHFTAS